MRAESVAATAAIGVLGVIGVAPAGAEVPDAKCETTPVTSMIDPRVAQTFTVLTTGHLVRFEATFSNTSTPSVWSVQINTVDGTGKPTNTALASTTVPVGGTPPFGVQKVAAGSFPDPAFVTAGERYALVIDNSDASANAPMANNTDPCAGQAFGDNSAAGTWHIDYPSHDLAFAVFVEPPPPPPGAERTLTLDANKGKVEKGKKVRLSGQLEATGNDPACEAGQNVEILRTGLKGGTPKVVATVQTDAQGNFATKVKVRKSSLYTGEVDESSACERETSDTAKVRVQKPKAAKEA